MNRPGLWIALTLTALVAPVRAQDPAGRFPQRWNYVRFNLMDGELVKAGVDPADKLIDILKLSKDSGCTHILLGESRMSRLCEQQPPEYYQRVEKVRAAARDLKLELIPIIFPIGYGGKYLYFDGNLMAGLPVADMPLIVKDGKGRPDASAVPALVNAGFEDAEGDKAAGWGDQTNAGVSQFIDRQVARSGKQSVRFGKADDLADTRARGASLRQTLPVKPFQYYRLSFYAKWDQKYPHLLQIGSNNQRKLMPTEVYMKPAKPGDWARYETVFNTLDATEITIGLGAYARPDPVWIDDVTLEPAGFMLIVRRSNAPLKITSADGATVYEEGKDFKPIYDPLINEKPFKGELDYTHAPGELELTADSRIREGQKVLASFYHSMLIGVDQMVISIQEPRILEIMDAEARSIVKVWPSSGYFMNYDEIRMGGWEPNPGGEKLTPGQILARHVRKGYDLVRQYAPQADVYTWSDMFTPHHNARPASVSGPYWLTSGNWDGSWEGLPKDVIILNWYAPTPEGITFFSDRGHKQVLCGYYDAKGTEAMKGNIHKWRVVSEGAPGILGFCYTTWKSNYTNMKEYFQLLDSYGQWATTMPWPLKTPPATRPATTASAPASRPATAPAQLPPEEQ